MATTFTVFSLGVNADIDTVEGNTLAENADALVGSVFGGPDNALFNSAKTFSPGTGGFAKGVDTAYDQNNTPGENFRINGGSNQTFDSSVIYDATITYTNGSTAKITAVIFQDTTGNTYWAPEFTANSDQAAMEAGPIQSLSLDSLSGANFSGMTGSRESWSVVTCYVRGTAIRAEKGDTLIETLKIGDLVETRDNGLQPIRWIGQSKTIATDKQAPIRIRAGALGTNIPLRDLYVSRQHRILLQSKIAERLFGALEILVPAIKLVSLPNIDEMPVPMPVTYFHLLMDRHEIIFAENAQSETLLTGPNACHAMGPEALADLEQTFPGTLASALIPARPICRDARLALLFERHQKHQRAYAA